MNQFDLNDLIGVVTDCIGSGDETEPLTEKNLDSEFDELGYDSLTIYEIVTKIQDALHIAVSDEEVDALLTPRTVLDLVNLRLAEAA